MRLIVLYVAWECELLPALLALPPHNLRGAVLVLVLALTLLTVVRDMFQDGS